MQSEIYKQVQNSYKYTEIKYPRGDKLFAGCREGYLIRLSMIEKKPIYDQRKISSFPIYSMAKTSDNKS